MLLTVVYGVYTVFFEGKGGVEPAVAIGSSAKELENLNAFITKIAEASRSGISEADKYIIERAESEWKQDPLVSVNLTNVPESEMKIKEVPRVSIPDLKVTYTGFMKMGDKTFAIINGVEYAAGDSLEQGDYMVRSITPDQVVIVSSRDSKQRFVFPLEEQ